MDSLEQLPPLRDVIAKYRLSARRRLGQNFLFDLNLTAKIARLAGTTTGHDVLEIGPGPGGLTRSLVAGGARKIVAIEKDPRFLPALNEIARASSGILTVINEDALKIDPASLISPPARIIANLPYNVGTELLARWLSTPAWPPPWSSLTLAFQRELAERLVAAPGSKSYGRLSILAQWRTTARIAMLIPPSAFVPPPKVTSAIVHLECLPAPIADADADLLFRLVKSAFAQRRKMLRTSLKQTAPNINQIIEAAGVSPEARADAVRVEDYCALARQFKKSGISPGSIGS